CVRTIRCRVGNWDDHAVNHHVFDALKYRAPFFDRAVAALAEDVFDRGPDRRVLVVATGEFGRTPRINQNGGATPGRQHWPHCYSAILAGGGIRGGMVYGESDKIGAFVKDKPVRPQDFSATLYHALGVPFEARVTRDGVSRPLS